MNAVRLVDGGSSGRDGRLEVRIGDAWGPVQWSGNTNPAEELQLARAVCRRLGFGGGARRYGDDGKGFYGAGALPPLARDLRCRVGDGSLAACSFGRPAKQSEDGPYTEDLVGIACSGSNSVSRVRLAGSSSSKEGRVEVKMGDR